MEFELERTKLSAHFYIVDFYTNWCGPCLKFGKYFESLHNLDQIHIFKLDIENPEFSDFFGNFNVDGIPLIVFYDREGRNPEAIEGFDITNFDRILNKLLIKKEEPINRHPFEEQFTSEGDYTDMNPLSFL